MRNIALLTLIILAAVMQQNPLCNPGGCREVSYPYEQPANCFKNITGIIAGRDGAEGKREITTKATNNPGLPAFSTKFGEIAFFYLADDDINLALCGLSGKTKVSGCPIR